MHDMAGLMSLHILFVMTLGKIPVLLKPFGLQESFCCSFCAADFKGKFAESLVLDSPLPDEAAVVGVRFCPCKVEGVRRTSLGHAHNATAQ